MNQVPNENIDGTNSQVKDRVESDTKMEAPAAADAATTTITAADAAGVAAVGDPATGDAGEKQALGVEKVNGKVEDATGAGSGANTVVVTEAVGVAVEDPKLGAALEKADGKKEDTRRAKTAATTAAGAVADNKATSVESKENGTIEGK